MSLETSVSTGDDAVDLTKTAKQLVEFGHFAIEGTPCAYMEWGDPQNIVRIQYEKFDAYGATPQAAMDRMCADIKATWPNPGGIVFWRRYPTLDQQFNENRYKMSCRLQIRYLQEPTNAKRDPG